MPSRRITGAGVALAVAASTAGCGPTDIEKAEGRARTIANALAHARTTKVNYCPSPDILRSRGELTEGSIVDPWGQLLTTECKSFLVTVRSAGPDRKFDTKDDIVATAVSTPASSSTVAPTLPQFTRTPDPLALAIPATKPGVHEECLGCRTQRMQCASDVKAGRLPDGFESFSDPLDGCVLQYSACTQIALEQFAVRCP